MDGIETSAQGWSSQGTASAGLLARLTEMTLAKHSLWYEAVFATGGFALALYIRFVADPILPPGFPFLTFFPAVLLTSAFASVRSGVVVAIASGVAARYFFITPIESLSLNGASAVAMGFFTLVVLTEILLISAVKQALLRLRAAQQRSDDLATSSALMFSELQHRVSNNLATVAALLRLQAGQTKDVEAKQVLSVAQVRIDTISRLQRRLHSPNIQSVAVADFIQDMAADTIDAAGAGANVTLKFDLTPVQVVHEKAIPLGLIVSELLMNAVEHSPGPEVRAVVITISLSQEPREGGGHLVTLDVHDSGKGVPDGFDVDTSKSLGISIARQFALQLSGKLSLFNAADGGAISRLQFEN
ncbi:MAG: histidine kinase dimerization/phosphoacceptor domain -containing protein [Cypionkella sp.]|uniref:sensor histidine kinase n=1 Tax=Cypionkella sp. TaxID=2811411 RepID=UPI002ABB7960|nr:histidine kinase dimerization/phosphoacceptor domain -containing protein [Cypionkella sp.]MDZ4311432.1 histidine kinase dimerization/phosphoacceptor domain -containing protein [Cypionkella sp.]